MQLSSQTVSYDIQVHKLYHWCTLKSIQYLLHNRSTTKSLFGEDYHSKFDTQVYLQKYADSPDPIRLFPLKHLHEFYQSYKSTERKLKILDIGTGPVISYAISAAPYASEIVLSEYTEANRKELLQWVQNDPKAHDWTPFLKTVVVDLEGKSEEEVPVRAELIRKVIKAVVPCDVTCDPPIPMQYVDRYDVVTSFLCLMSACTTREDYMAALVRLCALLKPGGKIVLYTAERKESYSSNSSYSVGSQKFFDLQLSREFIYKSLERAGFCNVKAVVLTRDDLHWTDDKRPELVAFIFVTACKMD